MAKLFTWGNNANFVTAQGTNLGHTTTITQVGTDTDWTHISIGNGWGCAVKDGRLYTWGANSLFRTGAGTSSGTTTAPTQRTAHTDWTYVNAGTQYTGFGIRNGGELWVWGYGAEDTTGTGSTANVTVPTRLGVATNWVKVVASQYHALGLRADGTLWSWGRSNVYQLGFNSTTTVSTPTQVGTDTDWTDIAVALQDASFAIKGGELYSCGSNERGRTGQGTAVGNTILFTKVGSFTDWEKLGGRRFFGNAAIRAGRLYTWGHNTGAVTGLGINNTSSTLAPTQVGSGTGWADVAVGSCGVGIESGNLFVWGVATNYETGQGDTNVRTTPQISNNQAADASFVTSGSQASALLQEVPPPPVPETLLATTLSKTITNQPANLKADDNLSVSTLSKNITTNAATLNEQQLVVANTLSKTIVTKSVTLNEQEIIGVNTLAITKTLNPVNINQQEIVHSDTLSKTITTKAAFVMETDLVEVNTLAITKTLLKAGVNDIVAVGKLEKNVVTKPADVLYVLSSPAAITGFTTSSGSQLNINITLPAHSVGQLLFVLVSQARDASFASVPSILQNVSAGWTQRFNVLMPSSSPHGRVTLLTRRATSTNHTLTFANSNMNVGYPTAVISYAINCDYFSWAAGTGVNASIVIPPAISSNGIGVLSGSDTWAVGIDTLMMTSLGRSANVTVTAPSPGWTIQGNRSAGTPNTYYTHLVSYIKSDEVTTQPPSYNLSGNARHAPMTFAYWNDKVVVDFILPKPLSKSITTKPATVVQETTFNVTTLQKQITTNPVVVNVGQNIMLTTLSKTITTNPVNVKADEAIVINTLQKNVTTQAANINAKVFVQVERLAITKTLHPVRVISTLIAVDSPLEIIKTLLPVTIREDEIIFVNTLQKSITSNRHFAGYLIPPRATRVRAPGWSGDGNISTITFTEQDATVEQRVGQWTKPEDEEAVFIPQANVGQWTEPAVQQAVWIKPENSTQ